MKYTEEEILRANELNDLWDVLGEDMGEMAALDAACEQLGHNKGDVWDILEPINEAVN